MKKLLLSLKALTVTTGFLLSTGCLAHPVLDAEIEIQENLKDLNPNVEIHHSQTFIEYAKKCNGRNYSLEVKPFRYRLNKYRINIQCQGLDRHSSVTEVSGSIKTFVSKVEIERKTPIHRDLVSKKSTNLSSIRGIIAKDVPDLYYSAKGNIKANSVIYQKNLVVRPMISRGDAVTMVASVNGITLKAKGIALEDGMFNQRIEVENKTSKKTLMAIVINNKTVRVK
ncbi:flagellar basal body P-ring formation chaperone FlgA [Vibrio sp. D431a]|uniref:flagellar basal body P-ring formation chaperone FlgA n=1 Tax=Vibrio sp. D431a TaxID=2837388 RepID=UPI0025576ECD|nr:flagellar basal body P-ring formation chaperone FlgA [Vibrio sp. D431a]MDK9793918.1 flagellar basal body P-ring formation protein FlgA [Vibrio sp. D431a]